MQELKPAGFLMPLPVNLAPLPAAARHDQHLLITVHCCPHSVLARHPETSPGDDFSITFLCKMKVLFLPGSATRTTLLTVARLAGILAV